MTENRRPAAKLKPLTANQSRFMTEPILAPSSYKKAMDSALRLMARRDHTRFEIQQKLKQRRFGKKIVDTVLAECERLNYIDDQRTARVYIEQLIRKGFGFRRIRLEFKKKGLLGTVFDEIIKESRAEINEHEIATRVLQKKMRVSEIGGDPQKLRAKLYRFLYGRGFSGEVISETIRKFV